MTDSPLLVKSKAFALEIIRVCNEIKRSQKESIPTNQLVRSGTSIGANISEANCSISKKEFLSKMYIAFKECAESKYWLDLLSDTDYLTQTEYDSIMNDCTEIQKLLSSITKTTRENS